MRLVKLEKYLLAPPNKEPYNIIFYCEENGRFFRLISKEPLTDQKFFDWGLKIYWGDPRQTLGTLYALVDNNVVTTIRGDIDSNPIILNMKKNLKKQKSKQETEENKPKDPPATQEEITEIFSTIKNLLKPVPPGEVIDWYERSKAHEG